MLLVGRTSACKNGVIDFAQDLVDNLAHGDANHRALLDEADAYILRNGLGLPEEPDARAVTANSDCIVHPLRSLDLAQAGVTTIIWATALPRTTVG